MIIRENLPAPEGRVRMAEVSPREDDGPETPCHERKMLLNIFDDMGATMPLANTVSQERIQ